MVTLALLLMSCAGPGTTDTSVSDLVPLGEAALARRMSIDLRGVVPTVEELATAESDGADSLIEGWLADPRFETHLVDALAEDWLVRADELKLEADEFGVDTDAYTFARSFSNEPTRLMARIAAEDRPWTETVTADWTMANDTLGEILPLTFTDPSDTSEWRVAHYTDGRPAGGVVMTSGLWLRYSTTLFNYNRGRAAALAKYLLCVDIASRPVAFVAFPGTSSIEQESAVHTEPTCVACHASLDPLAGTLFGFWPFEDEDGAEVVRYHPEREHYGEILTGVSPAYFGTPVTSAAQLGPLIAADPRFAVCTAQRTAARLWGRQPADDEYAKVVALQQALTAGGFTMKALLRAVLATEDYRVGAVTDDAPDEVIAQARTVRVLSTTTLASAVEDLTGFRWTYESADELDGDVTGYRVLLGGADGNTVRSPNPTPTVSQAVAMQRLAELAGAYVAGADLAAVRSDRRLIGTTVDDAALAPDDDALAAELIVVHRRLLGVTPDADELTDLSDLYAAIASSDGSEAGWAAVVSTLLRDPAFWTY